MSFIKFLPYGEKSPNDISTTTAFEIQLWQELTCLRHISGTHAIYARQTISPWIDQSKVYFLDAYKSNWKSSGLLYYYSFLNLAKAFLVTKRGLSGKFLKSTSIYHGLSAQPQNPRNITDFRVEVHPPLQGRKKNIFSLFYQKLINEPWPFPGNVTIKISDILGYCPEISHESGLFFSVEPKVIPMLSLYRQTNTDMWLELIVHDTKIPILQNDLGAVLGLTTNFAGMSPLDKGDWFAAYRATATSLQNHSLIRFNQLPYTAANVTQQFNTLQQNVTDIFKGFILPFPSNDSDTNENWRYISKLNLNGTLIKWHPLLSDYLFAFVLSTILRYQPHLFTDNSKNSFVAEAWCNQSAITAIRYFLMEISKQNLRVN